MTDPAPLRVLIAGGGIGGLCLANGLRGAGLAVRVFERDAPDTRRSGYRLHMSANGGAGLARCLPDDLYRLYLQVSRTTPPRALAVVIDEQCHEVSSMPHVGPPNEGPLPHTAIDRRTLRQILAARLGDVVEHGRAATGFTQTDEDVRLHLDDGEVVTGDVLVGADGIASAVRRQLLPEVEIVGSEVSGLGLFARSPLTPEIVAELPPILLDGFVIARDQRGGMLAIGAYTPRRPAAEATAELAPDVTLAPVAPYMMLSGGLGPGVTPPPLSEWDADTPAQMLAGMRATVADWHPALRGLVDRVELPTLFSFPFRQLRPADPWPSSRVTLLGDAAHAMLPTLGQGGNMALRDAGVLCGELSAAARGERPLVEAIAAYEAEMRDRVYPLMEASSDHDSFGGGGLRNRPRSAAGA